MSSDQLRARLQSAGVGRSVLVSLNGGEDRAELRALLDLVAAAPPDCFWWVRCHPLQRNRSVVREVMTSAGTDRVDVDLASTASLYEVLSHVDANITRFSSVVTDAAAFGVPSIITDSIGAELFVEEIRCGLAEVHSDGIGDVAAALGALRPRAVPDDASMHSTAGQWALALVRG